MFGFFCRLEFTYAISDSTFHLTALLIFHFRDLQDLEQVEFGQVVVNVDFHALLPDSVSANRKIVFVLTRAACFDECDGFCGPYRPDLIPFMTLLPHSLKRS